MVLILLKYLLGSVLFLVFFGSFVVHEKAKKYEFFFKTCFALLLCCVSLQIQAQHVNLKWVKSTGGNGIDSESFMTFDAAENVYITGFFNGTVDFDPGTGVSNLTSNGGNDIFIQKLDSSGNFLWANSIGGASNDGGLSIITDRFGNIYTTGEFRDIVDFDPGTGVSNLISNGDNDIFVQKWSSNGNFLWAKSMGDIGSDKGVSIFVDSLGNIYTSGMFEDTTDFDPRVGVSNLIANGESDVFIQKLDSNGNFLWAQSVGGTGFDTLTSMNIDLLGNIYLGGSFQDTVDFDPGIGVINSVANGLSDIFVLKINKNGNLLWAKIIGGTGMDQSTFVIADDLGNVYTTGSFSGTVDFDPGTGTSPITSNGLKDIFLQKLDVNGDLVWAKSIGSSNSDVGYSIALDQFRNIYTTGYFSDTVDFDPGAGITNLISNGTKDIFIQKLGMNGNLRWAKSMGGTNNDFGSSININAQGNVYVAGNFATTVDFDPESGTSNLTSQGNHDIFIQKLGQICIPVIGTDVQTACDNYTWINGITYTTTNNTAKDTLTSFEGCDSIVTLNLTINNIDNTVADNNSTLTANEAGATYQWLDCGNSKLPITGETSKSFTATLSGDYAVEITKNNCVDTSDCVTVSVIDNIAEKNISSMSIYPNPTNGVVTINSAELVVSLKVLDFTGRTVLQTDRTKNIDLSSFDVGIYFLEVNTLQETIIKKIIKK